MKLRCPNTVTDRDRITDPTFSRRSALAASGLSAVALLSGSALGQTAGKEADAKKPAPPLSRESQERAEAYKAFGERMRNAGSKEERDQIMSEQRAWQREMEVESLKGELRVSEREWRVVKPRLEAVRNLARPGAMVIQGGAGAQPKTEVDRRRWELQKLVQEDKPDMGQIKTTLAAYRAAKEKAKQEVAKAQESLRQVMDLRQEAVLVLRDLLD